MVGGVRFEHTHRMVAEFVGLLTIVIAIWTWRTDKRSWMKALGLGALGTVIAQGILGGITVLHFLPPAVSTAHAMVGQTFFCIAVAIALFTEPEVGGRSAAIAGRPASSQPDHADRALNFHPLRTIVFRRNVSPSRNGVASACDECAAGHDCAGLDWTSRPDLLFENRCLARRPANLLLILLVTQLCLGYLAFQTRVIWGHEAVQPHSQWFCHSRSRRRRSAAPGNRGGACDSGLAARSGVIRGASARKRGKACSRVVCDSFRIAFDFEYSLLRDLCPGSCNDPACNFGAECCASLWRAHCAKRRLLRCAPC